MSREFDNLNDLLRRFGYSGVEGNLLLDKKRAVALLSLMFGAVDVEQIVRCGVYSYPVARTTISQLSSDKGAIMKRLSLLNTSVGIYRAKSLESMGFSSVVCDKLNTVLSDAATAPYRLHDLFCSNTSFALAYSDIEAYRALYGRVLLRGMPSVKEMLRLYSDEALFTNALAPDMIARKHVGSLFFEVDRATEGSRQVGRKLMDYFEVLRSVSVEELSSCAIVVASYSYKDDNKFFGGRRLSLMKESSRSLYASSCQRAAVSLRKRASKHFGGADFLTCTFGGLRLLVVSGFDTWCPDRLNELLPVESGKLVRILTPVLRQCGRFGECPLGAYMRDVNGDLIVFPSVVLPAGESGSNSIPVIYENISADLCGRERALRLMTSKNFIRPNSGENAFLVMDVDGVKDAEAFLAMVGKRDAELYSTSDFRLSYLLKDGLYNTFRIFFRGGEPQYDVAGLGFIFRANGKFFLPGNDESFRKAYRNNDKGTPERSLA